MAAMLGQAGSAVFQGEVMSRCRLTEQEKKEEILSQGWKSIIPQRSCLCHARTSEVGAFVLSLVPSLFRFPLTC